MIDRVRIPVLMINRSFDANFQLEASQKPLVKLLGTPAADKRHVVYATGHSVHWVSEPENKPGATNGGEAENEWLAALDDFRNWLIREAA